MVSRLRIWLFWRVSSGLLMATPPLTLPPAAVWEYCPGYRFAAGDEEVGELRGALGIERRLYRPGQDDIVIDQLDVDLGIGDEAAQIVFKAGHVAFDGEVEAGNLLAIGAEHEDVCLPHLFAEQIDAPRRPRHRVRDAQVCYQNVVGVDRQIDD